MKTIIIYYCSILIIAMTVMSFLRAESIAQIISAIIFFPLAAYFIDQVMTQKPSRSLIAMYHFLLGKRNSRSTSLSKIDSGEALSLTKSPTSEPVEEGEVVKEGFDIDRRMLLKIIGSAGTGLFMMSLFTTKSHAAFFGSTPGQGTIGVKDTTGALIDPAIKTPTDGYKISEVDDASSPAYYGFVDKTGAWFIMKEESSGAYRYSKGSSNFSTNWTGRALLSYGYFDSIF